MTAPVRVVKQASLDRTLTDHAKRIRALEASPGGSGSGGCGDYVFIQQVTVAVDGDPIVFTGIDQTFDHLVVEIEAVSAYTITPGVASDPPDDVTVEWGNAAFGNYYNDDYVWGQGWVSQTLDTWQALDDTFDDIYVPIKKILPAQNINGAGSPNDGGVRALITLKFPYYSRTDLTKGLLWQAASQVQRGGISSEGNFTVTVGAYSTGGGSNSFDVEPLDRIRIDAKTQGLLAGSRAILYGVSRGCGGGGSGSGVAPISQMKVGGVTTYASLLATEAAVEDTIALTAEFDTWENNLLNLTLSADSQTVFFNEQFVTADAVDAAAVYGSNCLWDLSAATRGQIYRRNDVLRVGDGAVCQVYLDNTEVVGGTHAGFWGRNLSVTVGAQGQITMDSLILHIAGPTIDQIAYDLIYHDTAHGTGNMTGFSADVDAYDGDAVGFEAQAVALGGGDAIGAKLSAAVVGAGTPYAIKVAAGLVLLALPTSPGPTGTLWNDSGTVKVA